MIGNRITLDIPRDVADLERDQRLVESNPRPPVTPSVCNCDWCRLFLGFRFGSLGLAKLHPRLENSAASLLPQLAACKPMLPTRP